MDEMENSEVAAPNWLAAYSILGLRIDWAMNRMNELSAEIVRREPELKTMVAANAESVIKGWEMLASGAVEVYLNAMEALVLTVSRRYIPFDVVRQDYGKRFIQAATPYTKELERYPVIADFIQRLELA